MRMNYVNILKTKIIRINNNLVVGIIKGKRKMITLKFNKRESMIILITILLINLIYANYRNFRNRDSANSKISIIRNLLLHQEEGLLTQWIQLLLKNIYSPKMAFAITVMVLLMREDFIFMKIPVKEVTIICMKVN